MRDIDDITAIVKELIALGASANLVARVAALGAMAMALTQRRANDAARKRMSRDSMDVTGRHVTDGMSRDKSKEPTENIDENVRRHVTGRMSRDPPMHIDNIIPPKKRSRSPRQTLPADFTLTESDNRYALERGWTAAKIAAEFDRFRNHATAKGAKYADWHAAWRNWVTSPYQSKTNGPPNDKQTRRGSVVDVLAGLGGEEGENPDGLLPLD